MKKAEDSDALILRMYEYTGKDGEVKVSLPAGATHAAITNMMEKEDGAALPVTDNAVMVPIHPYEILTLKVSYTR